MSQLTAMNLQITLPHHLLLEKRIKRLLAEGVHGSFGLRPNHLDCLSILQPGIFVYEALDGVEHYLGVGSGMLVKQGSRVFVSASNAVPGDDLAQLQQAVAKQFNQLDEQARLVESALARLESGLARHFSILVEGT
ncbi:ATP synthase F1, epsilon subunit [Synechococcus sp. PCC 7335]|uniref:F0F1 ATP synthase subunit epsilon n=1 Tax=Synechococcus sp. (strain ATCC 29403 / PCC 7335) TaxID=91464 RepID=UPI00017ED656|nr:F0F1 ATP synthase subunit epsilon [Synechococcus sp. PCC 7335]EDX83572.1 ATP synthase F1, epsilon subunit [Synechococcus sp. PCC 7335]